MCWQNTSVSMHKQLLMLVLLPLRILPAHSLAYCRGGTRISWAMLMSAASFPEAQAHRREHFQLMFCHEEVICALNCP